MYNFVNACFVMYADEILLLAPSVHSLQILVSACESTFGQLDFAISVRKSVCIRIGPRWRRCRFSCSPILLSDGSELQWIENVRYLGVCVTRSTHFSCSFDNAKKSFYWSFNAVFGKIGRIASENVVMQLINLNVCPYYHNAVDACPINRTLERSLQFPLTRIMMKIFKTTPKKLQTTVNYTSAFNPYVMQLKKRKINFLNKVSTTCNALCKLFVSTASSEMITLCSAT